MSERTRIQSTTMAPPQPARLPAARPFATVVQPKLRVTAPSDVYEQEADRVADQVMRKAVGAAGDPPEDEEDRPRGQVMRKAIGGAPAGVPVAPPVAAGIDAARGGGQALPGDLRARMERGIGHRFTGVRLHSDGRAAALSQALQARAFTSGRDIFFGAGAYRPTSAEGQRLIAHELSHVVQQSGGASGLIQRAVGFEFETGWLIHKQGLLGFKTMKKGDVIKKYNGFKMTADETIDGDSEIEFVVDPPVEETDPIARLNLTTTMNDLEWLATKLVTAAGKTALFTFNDVTRLLQSQAGVASGGRMEASGRG